MDKWSHFGAASLRLLWLVTTAIVVASPLASAKAIDPRSVAEDLARSEGLQTEITESDAEAESHRPQTAVPTWVLWVAATLGGAMVLYALRDTFPTWDRRRRIESLELAAEQGGVASARDSAQRQADELANLGRFTEAIHLLLLRAVLELRGKLNVPIADSLTAREIERRAPLDARGKAAFGGLVRAVERALFAKVDADSIVYSACRADFDVLIAAIDAGSSA